MNQSTKIRILSEKLNSNNPSLVSESILQLREEEPFKGAIRLVAELLDRTDNQVIISLIKNFFNDLKNNDLRSEIIEELFRGYKNSTISIIASSCWQSGLDYSGYSKEFAELFIIGDYMVALECFTVLEECAPNADDAIRKSVLKVLENSSKKVATEKNPLFSELVKMFSWKETS